MLAVSKQIEIGGLLRDDEEQLEIEAGYRWRAELWSAMRIFATSYMEDRVKGYDACAQALNRRWAGEGRGISGAQLRAALADSERNNFRLEWIDWFAARDKDIADLVARRTKPKKTGDEYAADLEAEIREELSHKRAEAVIRRARAR